MKPLIVSEAPGRPRSGEADEPLAGKSGARLAALCGLDLPTFLATFDRVNVLPEWPGDNVKGFRFTLLRGIPAARERVLPLLPERARVIVLGRAGYALERALCEAGHTSARDLSFTNFVWHHVRMTPEGLPAIACCPHPSGVNRWWNVPANVEEAARFWSAFATTAQT